MNAPARLDGRSWTPVALPVGPQPLPAWLLDLRIDWEMNYGNSPRIDLLVDGHVLDWADKRWRREGHALYVAQHEDGRADFLTAHGEPELVDLIEVRRCYPPMFSCSGAFHIDGRPHTYERRWRCRVKKWATPRDEGFGGRHIEIVMENGTPLVLRGPWSSLALPDYQPVAYYPRGKDHAAKKPRRWASTGIAGLCISDDLWLRALARFAPECRAARVITHGIERLEPIRGDWTCPKDFLSPEQRRAA